MIKKGVSKNGPKGPAIRDLGTFEKAKAGIDPQFPKGSPFRNKQDSAKPPKGLLSK